MKISIVVPVYNVAPYVADCFRSIARQTWQGPLECVFVDDCGTDNSMSVVEHCIDDYSGPIDFRIVRHEHNRGLSAARNSGISAATGDYVYFLDSDDELSSDCIASLAAPLANEACDLIIGDCQIVGGEIPGVALQLKDGQVLRGREVLHAYCLGKWYMMSVNKLYRLSLLRDHDLQFLEGILHEDELWSFQIACIAQSLAVVRRPTYIYKLREGSITVNTFSERNAQSINVILSAMSDFAVSHALLNNIDVHNIIQNFRIGTLSRIFHYAPDMLPAFYRQQRREMGDSWSRCCRLNGTDIRKQLRDFHLALPIIMALPYLRCLLHYYLKLSAK